MTITTSFRLFFAAFFAPPLMTGSAPAAMAQDVAPETPAELRDFKLDPEKAPPVREPLPTTEPTIKSPAASSVQAPAARSPVIEVPRFRVPAAKAPAPQNRSGNSAAVPPRKAAPNDASAPPPETKQPPDTAVEPAASPDVNGAALPQSESPAAAVSDAVTAAPEIVPVDGPAPPGSPPWAYILAGLFVAGGTAISWLLMRRRRAVINTADQALTVAAAPHVSPDLPISPKIKPSPIIQNRPQLGIAFVPEKASISLTNLTIKGRLQITNGGAGDAESMQLNAAVISASEGQSAAIARYFSSVQPRGKDLGAAKVGEQIALEMNLMIPIADLQTFPVAQQKLLVPIILARVAYQWNGGMRSDEAQLSCLIGREGTPPKPKMGALRLDLGPRSFASLGQRPVPG